MTYDREQRTIMVHSAIAVLLAAAILVAGFAWLPPERLGLTDAMDEGERIAAALKADLFILIWLAACVQAVARGRFYSPADRPGSAFAPPSPAIAVRSAVLQNSLEQTVLALGAHLTLAVLLRGSELVLIPLLVALYLVGRLAFAFRYAQGAAARAFGMALTGASILAGYGIALALLIAGR